MGEGASTWASAARRASPPDSVARLLVTGQPKLLQQVAGPVPILIGIADQSGLHVGERGGEAGQVRFLRQVADGSAGLGEAAARVRLDQSGGDAQQGWICPTRCARPGTAGRQARQPVRRRPVSATIAQKQS